MLIFAECLYYIRSPLKDLFLKMYSQMMKFTIVEQQMKSLPITSKYQL